MSKILRLLALPTLLLGSVWLSAQQPDSEPPADSGPAALTQQRSEVELIIGDRIGAQPRIAVPDCLALTDDPETAAAAKTIS